jgi:riboflavin synthase
MFTGIIEETGILLNIKRNGDSAVLTIGAKEILEDIKCGDSIAVNGICLTVTSFQKGRQAAAGTFTVDVMHETLNRSSIGQTAGKSSVNLERAMRADGRFGGHIVSGHIDGTGTIKEIKKDANAVWYTIAAAPKILRYIVEKGSIAIDGISLTVAKLDTDSFAVSVIPHTVAHTTLGTKKAGDLVNLENDCIGKYVERMLSTGDATCGSTAGFPNKTKTPGITRETLSKYGF